MMARRRETLFVGLATVARRTVAGGFGDHPAEPDRYPPLTTDLRPSFHP